MTNFEELPERPENVRIHKASGIEIPANLEYVDIDLETGVRVWKVTNTDFNEKAGDSLRIEKLPPLTAVAVDMTDEEKAEENGTNI